MKKFLQAVWCRVAHVKHHIYTYHASPPPHTYPSFWSGRCEKCGRKWIDEAWMKFWS